MLVGVCSQKVKHLGLGLFSHIHREECADAGWAQLRHSLEIALLREHSEVAFASSFRIHVNSVEFLSPCEVLQCVAFTLHVHFPAPFLVSLLPILTRLPVAIGPAVQPNPRPGQQSLAAWAGMPCGSRPQARLVCFPETSELLGSCGLGSERSCQLV